jgi:hypothetical protein
MPMQLDFEFAFRDKVLLDGSDVAGVITGVAGYSGQSGWRCLYEVSWWSSGSKHEAWFEPWRLRKNKEA